ncbi:sulfatase [Paenibacillus allorhizosphaerae]|uniref:N-acetylgalactosamine-6-O-sulfatase n=1 Tax=Paenibacillus allorhizosphaerae TaxID=2849866 RepID=A0ABM8VQK1_9BACL|nr:sulfatase [Paenibacillus allorhizosphaerae]CAG7654336.1 N-acetylgalactosamine-6-O-sulfatase [Paenibacillus allorhizosphaerae]
MKKMTRRQFIVNGSALLAAMMSGCRKTVSDLAGMKETEEAVKRVPVRPTRDKPNLLFVFFDDAGYGDFGAYGNRQIKTPVIDQIAQYGVKFTQMYAAAPVCSPSRAALLTGRYAQRVGIPDVLGPDAKTGIGKTEKTLATYLKDQGYVSNMIGKWHLGSLPPFFPTKHGFDRFYGVLYSNDMEPFDLYENEAMVQANVDKTKLAEWYSNEAIRFIETNKDRPFFVYLAHNYPHDPQMPPREFAGKSEGGKYGDSLESADFYLGKIIETLKKNGILDNTIIMVSSDHGPGRLGSTGGLRGRKFDVYEGGIRVPLVAQWNTVIPPGTVSGEVSSLMDIVPTIVSLAGGTVDSSRVDGKNMFPLLQGQGSSPHEELYFYYRNSLNAVRSGQWKLHIAKGTQGDKTGMPELYDLAADPGEKTNLASRHPELVQALTAKIRSFDQNMKR